MGKVNSNDVGFAIAREQSLGVLPVTPDWRQIEPNGFGSFGNEIKTAARRPISKDRQRRKGAVIDLDSGFEIEADCTISALRDVLEAFIYSVAVGPDSYLPTAVAAGSYTVPAVSAGQSGRLIYSALGAKSLLFARDWVTPANNGLKVLGGAVAAAATAIPVAGVVVEAQPANKIAELSIAGVRCKAGDLDVDAQGNLITTELDLRTLGLFVGQTIWVGGVDVNNQFFNVANKGFARIAAIAQNKLTLAKRANAFVADDGTSTGAGGAPLAIDLLFGQFIRNVAVDHADYRTISYQGELSSPGLGAGGERMYEYSVGNLADTLTIALPLTNLATVKMGFIGQRTTDPSTVRAAESANARAPSQTEAFGTASDLARLRLADIDEAGLSTDFKTLSLVIKNNASGEKVLGTLGSKFINVGLIEGDIDAELIFTNANVAKRITANNTVGLDFAINNADGGVHFDFPSGTIGDGKRSYPVDESVKIATKFAAFKDETYGFTLGVSLFPILPAEA
jgi:Phage tail tube protein